MLQESEMTKTCLITGGNGYLGKYISDHLNSLGWKIATLGLKEANTYQCNLKENIPVLLGSFDAVVHCAGRAHFFPSTKEEKQDFFNVNINGTKNLLKALEKASSLPKALVFLSSVSVYGLDKGELVNEETPLQSKYAYGQSKIEAEKILIEWCNKNQVKCAILRVPLLAGKNPPGNLKNMIDSIRKGYYFNISSTVRKSMVMAEDVARIVPVALSVGGIYNLTDGAHPYVKDLANLIAKQLGKTSPFTLPVPISPLLLFFSKLFLPFFPEETYKLQKLAATLTFDDSKARNMLGWNPSKVLDKFLIK